MRHFGSLKSQGEFYTSDKFLFKILTLYLDFVKFTVAKIDLHLQIVPHTLTNCPVTELGVRF